MKYLNILFIGWSLINSPLIYAEALSEPAGNKNQQSIIYLQPNTTQLFTELYQAHGLLNLNKKTVFEDALYLDQSTPPSILPFQPSNTNVFDQASRVLSEFHNRVNDLELYIDPSKPKPLFFVASGSKQLIVALVYGIAMSEPNKKFLFVEQSPFYSGHPNAVTGIFNYPNARFLAFHNPSEIVLEPGETLVEFVTSPNNPDGKFRKPLTDASIIIADFVFASSAFGDGTGYIEKNIEWIKSARASGKHVFSFNSASKQFGKTGARCGYIWYPMYDQYASMIFKKFFHFISASTVGGGSTGLANFLDLIHAFLGLPDSGKALRNDGYQSLLKRHKLVEKELLSRYPESTILSIPGSPTFFAKIKDARIPAKGASDVLLEDLSVAVNNGEPMGESNEFIRLNLSGYSQLLVEFLNRLSGKNNYKIEDVFTTIGKDCSYYKVCAQDSKNTLYIASPGNCLIDADAYKGSIEVYFPPFINYDLSQVITIKKVDSSVNPVTVKSDNFVKVLQKEGEFLQIQWSQPNYANGKWNIKSL